MRTTLTDEALRQMFSPEASDTFICLLTFVTQSETIRLCDNWTQRILETDNEVRYGTISRGDTFTWLPIRLNLPTEEKAAAPRWQVQIDDVTGYLIPTIRGVYNAITVTLEVVLKSAPNTVQIEFPNFLMGSISYDENTVSGIISLESHTNEPFPAHNITPMYFPGVF